MQINLQVVVSIWLLWLFVKYEETFRFRVYYWLSTFKFLVFFSVFLFSRTISSFDSHIMSKQRALFQWTWEFLWLVFALFCFDLLHLIHSYFCLTCWNLCIAGLKQFTGVKNSICCTHEKALDLIIHSSSFYTTQRAKLFGQE